MRPAGPGAQVRIRMLAGAASLIALWALHRTYRGIVHDARIYIGRAMAELDPAGVGQDLMFTFDQQSQFSAFPPLFTLLTGALGPAAAAIVLTLTGLALWLAAATLLVRRLAEGRTRRAALICVIVLPAGYAGLQVFSYAEAFATPRLYAEAAALAGIALFLGRRRWAAGALLLAALAIHPLVGLPVAAVAGVMLAVEERRWLWVAGAGAAGVIGAAALGTPIAERLFTTIDPEWMQILEDRNTYLFATRWEAAELTRAVVQVTTVAIAAGVTAGAVRRLFAATAWVSAGGVLASVLMIDAASNLLFAQLQPWRGLWLAAVLANAALAIVAAQLWPAGTGGRLVLAAGASSWILADVSILALPLLALTVLLYRRRMRDRPAPKRTTVRIAWTLTGLALSVLVVARTMVLLDIAAGARRVGTQIPLGLVVGSGVLAGPLVALTIGWMLGRWRPAGASVLRTSASVAGCLALAGGALLLWDERSAYSRQVEAAGEPVAALLSDDDPGSTVLWLDGDVESWMLAGRPQWADPLQGAGSVFARALAVEWNGRISAVVELGLGRRHEISPFQEQLPPPRPRPRARTVQAACSLPMGPDTIVIPGGAPRGIEARAWIPDSPSYRLRLEDGSYSWQRYDEFAVVACP